MNLTQRNLVLLVLACGLAVPTYLQLRSEAETFVDVGSIPLMFDGFTSDNAGSILLAAPKDEQAAAGQVAYDQLLLQYSEDGWRIAALPNQVPGDLVSAPVLGKMVESEVFQHLRAIRSDEEALVQPDATAEQLAEYGLDDARAFVVKVTDLAGRNVVADLLIGKPAGQGAQGTEAVQGVFVRKRGSNDVVLYETQRPWPPQLDKQRWIDRTVLRVAPEKVRKLSIRNLSTNGRRVVFERERNEASWQCSDPPDGRGAVRQVEVEGLLQRLQYLAAQSLVRPLDRAGDMADYGLHPTPQVEIALGLDGDEVVELRIGNRLDDRNEYYMMCTGPDGMGSEFLVTCPSSVATRFELDVAQRLFDPKPQ